MEEERPQPASSREEEQGVSLPPPSTPQCNAEKFVPSAIVDGSKLIIRVGRHQPFQVDIGLKIIFSSHPLRKLERHLRSISYVADTANTTVVVDTGTLCQRFIPIMIGLHGGVIYTRDSTAHVVVPGSGLIKRTRVSAPSMPCKVANKFVSSQYFQSKSLLLDAEDGKAFFPWNSAAVNGMLCPDSQGGIVFIRADDSIFRYRMTDGMKIVNNEDDSSTKRRAAESGDSIELMDGRVVAWSAEVKFNTVSHFICCRRVAGATGCGAIWVDGGRNPSATAAAAAAGNPLMN